MLQQQAGFECNAFVQVMDIYHVSPKLRLDVAELLYGLPVAGRKKQREGEQTQEQVSILSRCEGEWAAPYLSTTLGVPMDWFGKARVKDTQSVWPCMRHFSRHRCRRSSPRSV